MPIPQASRPIEWLGDTPELQISEVCHDEGSIAWHNPGFTLGEVAEWLMAADCKSALLRVRWFESSPLHQ